MITSLPSQPIVVSGCRSWWTQLPSLERRHAFIDEMIMSLQLICYFCLENNSVQNDHIHSILPAGIPIWPNLFAFSSCYGDVAFKSNQNSENFGTELSGMEISGEKWILTVCISLGSGIVRSLQIVKRLLRRNTWEALEREIARHRLLCLYSSCSSSVYFP